MNTRTLIAAATLTFAAAGSAFAQEAINDSNFSVIQSTTTRAAVMAEAQRALASGQLHETAQLNPAIVVESRLSREAVRAATAQAVRSGSIDRANAEAYLFG